MSTFVSAPVTWNVENKMYLTALREGILILFDNKEVESNMLLYFSLFIYIKSFLLFLKEIKQNK